VINSTESPAGAHCQTYLYMHIAGCACDTALMRIWKFHFQTCLVPA